MSKMEKVLEINNSDYEKLKNAISQISILIAGADGDIDQEEIKWSEKIRKIRTYNEPQLLNQFYLDVGKDFDAKIYELINKFELNQHVVQEEIIHELEELNPILQKLEPKYGALFYRSFVGFAKHVAKASGGFLRMWSISKEEKKIVDLPMLEPIEYIEENSESESNSSEND